MDHPHKSPVTATAAASQTGDPGHCGDAGGRGSAMALAGVGVGYEPGRPILTDFTARLAAGRVTVLIGPNAAGKSTLLRLMLGQLRPWSGRITLHDQPITALSAGRRARWISHVPQRGSCGFAFTVRQVVRMGRHVHGDDPRVIEWVLGACDLTDVAERVFHHLSVGQQQRVLLARALAQASGRWPSEAGAGSGPRHDGCVMLLDEPVSAMDPRHVHQTMALLRRRVDQGLSVLVVLHDLNLAARYGDELWLLHEGRLIRAGSWRDVLDPDVLNPVYAVRFENLAGPGQRPMLRVEPLDG
jgi:iron complex transport system ATP-binding protein